MAREIPLNAAPFTLMSAEHLSTALFRETRGAGFFRVLAGKNAPFYVDVLDALEVETSDRSDGIGREEAVALIVETLERHPNIEFEDEEGEMPVDLREKARALLEYLLKCHWLEEPPRRGWRRKIHFDAHGATILTALRKVAWPDAAVFTDKLTGVCAMLADEVELAERPWQTIENCLSSVREGLNELRSMQKSVQRFTRKQLEEETLRGNLGVVFDDYSEQISRSCYAALVRARLPTRLPDTVRRIAERLGDDPPSLADMQIEVLKRNPGLTAESARAKVAGELEELIGMLERVLPMADEIDRRTADFTRRSLARFRYLQDVTGERRTEIKSLFEVANRLMAGKKLQRVNASLPDLPDLLLPAVKLPAGLDSLYSPPNRRPPLEQDAFEDAVSDTDRESGLHDMQRTIRESLSVARANRFIRALPGGKGERIESNDLDLGDELKAPDLVALLLHAEAPEARYRLEVSRVTDEFSTPPTDELHGVRVEHFAIIKK
ncbi:DUF5716 family protein [Luteolibacter sp. SL250]|uniref:Wadjet anti-phage system protein JetA family protein n=1 Tax=Luteolibacter sp. SL250 TaxID=2995170 RepID=UPI002270B970|nr:Wadjet anti-phage system protein JetA family protein [Luteolibacter sp. SL250]WAC18341.1 DUF5716 family protein [Luteolibacter sp. SL250]